MFKNSVGRPSNETIKKRRIIKALALSIAFIAILSITYTLTNININTKRLKGDSSASYCDESSSCYQAGFRDFNFYKEVIDIYNHENAIDLSYNDIITDEQLLSITRLSAQALGIDNITGIEKLVNLTYLDLSSNNISSIDLSNNINLTKLYMYQNSLTSINLTNNLELQDLNLQTNNLTELNLSSNINLTSLILDGNNISEINLDNNVNLTYLRISENSLSSIDLSNNINLTHLDLSSNNISTIDLSNNINLTHLDLSSNNISTIDLSNNINLTELYMDQNSLTSINLTNNIELQDLNLHTNNLTELNLSNNLNLTRLNLSDNNLDEIDLSNLIYLNELEIDFKCFNLNNINTNSLQIVYIGIQLLKNEVFDLYSELGITNDEISNMQVDDPNIASYNKGVLLFNDIGMSEIEFYVDDVKFSLQAIVMDPIESSKYDIDYEQRYIYVEEDNDNEIKNNLYYGHTLLDMLGIDEYDIRIDNNLLVISINIEVEGRVLVLEFRPYTLIKTGNNNETPNSSDDENNIDDNTNNNSQNNNEESSNNQSSNNNNQNDDENNKVEESTTNNIAIEKEDITSKKTTLNKFENNAKTYDDIVKYFIIGGIAIVLIIGAIIYTKRKK